MVRLGRSDAVANGAATTGPVLSTITPFQLSEINVSLTPSTAAVPITADQADSVAKKAFPSQAILETALAGCDLHTGVEVSCYAISVEPSHQPMTLTGPDGTVDANTTIYPTLALVLVDAQTGQLMDAIVSAAQPQPVSNGTPPTS
jgi:hypothetical protein